MQASWHQIHTKSSQFTITTGIKKEERKEKKKIQACKCITHEKGNMNHQQINSTRFPGPSKTFQT